jgi:hypothetical protein
MIKLNTVYSIDNGANSVVFTEGKKGSITGTHNEGTMTGFLEGNVFTGTFHNTKVNASGLIEITFHESGFDAKWKNGMEPGPMRGKWVGVLKSDLGKFISKINNPFELNYYIGNDGLSEIMEKLVGQSEALKEAFSKQLLVFVKENQEFLWLLPAYFQKLNAIEWLIDDGEIDGDINGFYSESQFADAMSTQIFSKQCMHFYSRSSLFAWNDEDEKVSLFNLILQDMGITLEELITSYNSDYKSSQQIHFIKFINNLRTVLYASIVRAFYSEELDNEDIGYLIISPLEDENIYTIEAETSGFGDALAWAIEDVLHCLKIDINDENYDEDWGNYSKNYEKMAESISDQESYNNPLIKF